MCNFFCHFRADESDHPLEVPHAPSQNEVTSFWAELVSNRMDMAVTAFILTYRKRYQTSPVVLSLVTSAPLLSPSRRFNRDHEQAKL